MYVPHKQRATPNESSRQQQPSIAVFCAEHDYRVIPPMAMQEDHTSFCMYVLSEPVEVEDGSSPLLLSPPSPSLLLPPSRAVAKSRSLYVRVRNTTNNNVVGEEGVGEVSSSAYIIDASHA